MAETPSVSELRANSLGDDPFNTTGSSSIDPVVPIDGHQTIVSSYNEFMTIPNEDRNNIVDQLPSPPSADKSPLGSGLDSSPGTVPPSIPLPPRTRDLTETASPFLFAPTTAEMASQHYP